MAITIRDNTALRRFELDAEGRIAYSNYTREGHVLTLLHTEVPKALEGRGIGSALVKGILDRARVEGLKIVPRCPFVKGYIERHREYADLLT
ncbi:MAG: N-acetyltransferase [Pseudolabrys sp.]|nr:N-acetyltransferase [Pseudolabrys sp.]